MHLCAITRGGDDDRPAVTHLITANGSTRVDKHGIIGCEKVHGCRYIIIFWLSAAEWLMRLVCQSRFSSQSARQWTAKGSGRLCERERRWAISRKRKKSSVFSLWQIKHGPFCHNTDCLILTWHMCCCTIWENCAFLTMEPAKHPTCHDSLADEKRLIVQRQQ